MADMDWQACIDEAAEVFGFPPTDPELRLIWSPGRVNLIGDHIDYSGGNVMPMALDLGTRAVVRPRSDDLIRGYSSEFPQDGMIWASLRDLAFDADRGWFSYALGVVEMFARQGLGLTTGFDLYLSGNIPVGAGLSSSASVELAVGVAVNNLGGFHQSPTELALIGQAAENDYIGVACGIMDQLAIAEGRTGSVLLMDCDQIAVTPIPFPQQDYAVVVANTNQRRSLSSSAYNERRRAVERALDLVNANRDPSLNPLPNLVQATVEDLMRSKSALDEADVLPFAMHTVTEQGRVLAAADALRFGNIEEFGRLMCQSHRSLRDDFQVTGSNLDALTEAAWDAPGVLGARMTGAGFGGCTVNLVERSRAQEAIDHIGPTYAEATGLKADFFVVAPDAGAREVTDQVER